MSSKTLIQCDFDDTVTLGDISFVLLDEYAGPEWRRLWNVHQRGEMTVGRFNELAFGLVKAGRQEMLDFIADKTTVRPGFREFVDMSRHKNFRLVIVSHGLDFYIAEILRGLGIGDVEYHAAETRIDPTGLKVRYLGHDGAVVDRDYKSGYAQHFLAEGYRVAYIGDGTSDIAPALACHRIFATEGPSDSLLKHCRTHGIACTPFVDFHDVDRELEDW